jgi:hypothetical protein
MRPLHVYWHIYPEAQIKPELRGNLIYVLEVPPIPGFSVLRWVFDPSGVDFPRFKMASLLPGGYHGIIFEGVNKDATEEIMASDPEILMSDREFLCYNRIVVTNSRNFFLIAPERGAETLSKPAACLLSGKALKSVAALAKSELELENSR